jgi:hypothetical protein
MSIKLLEKLHDSGELHDLLRSGLISVNVLTWFKIYKAYQFQMQKGVKKTQAITDVSDVFGVSERIVYRIIKRFEQ